MCDWLEKYHEEIIDEFRNIQKKYQDNRCIDICIYMTDVFTCRCLLQSIELDL